MRLQLSNSSASVSYTAGRFNCNFSASVSNTDVSAALSGRCYTLDVDAELGIDAMSEGVILELNENLTYTMFIHQPGLHRFTYNPATMPSVLKVISFGELGKKYFGLIMELVRRERLNRDESRCNPEPGGFYSPSCNPCNPLYPYDHFIIPILSKGHFFYRSPSLIILGNLCNQVTTSTPVSSKVSVTPLGANFHGTDKAKVFLF